VLATDVEAVIDSKPGVFGFYARNLNTGETIDINADCVLPAESAAKTFILVYYSRLVASGAIDPTMRVTLDDEHRYIGTGVLRFLGSGLAPTLDDLAWLMIIVSDNTATEVLYRMVGGPAAVNARMTALGLRSTRAVNVPSRWFPLLQSASSRDDFAREAKYPFGLTTPREMGRLIELLERGTLVDKPSSELMLRIMRGQLYRTRIPRYVTGFVIPHKTGDFLPYVGNDVGALESPGHTIVMSIFTANHFGSGEMLENAIGLIARDTADYFSYTH
jgi:beta-lactamase class A